MGKSKSTMQFAVIKFMRYYIRWPVLHSLWLVSVCVFRMTSPRPSLLNYSHDGVISSPLQKPMDLKQLKQRAAAIPPIVSCSLYILCVQGLIFFSTCFTQQLGKEYLFNLYEVSLTEAVFWNRKLICPLDWRLFSHSSGISIIPVSLLTEITV